MLYTMPLKKNALGPSEAACIEDYKVVSKEDGGWLVTILASTPKVSHTPSPHTTPLPRGHSILDHSRMQTHRVDFAGS